MLKIIKMIKRKILTRKILLVRLGPFALQPNAQTSAYHKRSYYSKTGCITSYIHYISGLQTAAGGGGGANVAFCLPLSGFWRPLLYAITTLKTIKDKKGSRSLTGYVSFKDS